MNGENRKEKCLLTYLLTCSKRCRNNIKKW